MVHVGQSVNYMPVKQSPGIMPRLKCLSISDWESLTLSLGVIHAYHTVLS